MKPHAQPQPDKRAQVDRLAEAVRKSARAASASDSLPRKLTWRTLKRALGLLEGYWALGSVVMTLAILVAAGGLAAPWLGRQVIDEGFPREGFAGDIAAVSRGCFALLAIQVFVFVAGYIQALLFNRIGQNAMDRLRTRVFRHMQHLSIGFYERREPGKIIARVTSDVDSVNELLRLVLQGLATDILKALGISVLLFAMHWKLALIAHLVVPFASVTMWAFRKFGERIFRRIRETLAGISTYLHETITGIRVVKAFAREDVSRQVFAELTLESANAGIAQGRLFGTLFPVIQFLTVGTMVALLSYGALLVMRLELTRGELFAFYTYAMMLGEPWRSLAELAMTAQRSAVALDRIFEVLDEEPTVVDREGAVPLETLRSEIRFEDVHFAYSEDAEILHGVSFSARLGQVIAIVGPTGAGKSTIIKLLARLYDVTGGRITFDGVDIRDGTIESVRRQTGLVPQDPFLFAGTLAENIAYGRPEASREEIEHAADVTRVAAIAERLPNGLDTPVHERGVKLSDGERQLLSMARAIAADARILILDEATSSVDLFTEAVVQQALDRVRQRGVTFVIAHRLATVRSADRILVLEDGRVTGAGAHSDLMAGCPMYRNLYLRRFEDETEEERAARQKETAIESRAEA